MPRFFPVAALEVAVLLAACAPAPDTGVAEAGSLKGAGSVVPPEQLWPGGDVFLVGNESLLGADFVSTMARAEAEIETETPVRIHFVSDPDESTHGFYTRLTEVAAETRSHATLGASQGHIVSSRGAVRHELGHVMGLSHTHQRTDRAEHIVMHWYQIMAHDPRLDQYPRLHVGPHVGPYDITSVMHYSSGPAPCASLTLRTDADEPGDTDDPDLCIREDDPRWVPEQPERYSEWDLATLATLYCDPRYCGDRCAPEERCELDTVRAHLERARAFERSDEGHAWAERYPWAAPDLADDARGEILTERCTNGVQDGAERGIDCGGTCFPCGLCDEQHVEPRECEALVALHDATNGFRWRGRVGWGEIPDVCSWEHVTCAYHPVEGYHIVRLSLHDQGLTGTLPSNIGELEYLRHLDLFGNRLEGLLPRELGALRRLAHLSLGLNRLTGPIPAELGELLALQSLGLHGNGLEGPVPDTLMNLKGARLFLHVNGCLTASGELARFLDERAPGWDGGCE